MIIRAPYPDAGGGGGSQRQFQMSDLPADFKLFEWDWARNDLITLDGNNKVASIADTWAGRVASTASAADRRSLSTLNGVQALYKAGSGAGTAADAVLLSDLTGLPFGNADRYIGIACQTNDGILGGYRGNTSNIYCMDTPFSPGLRFYYDTNRVTSQLSVNKALAHFYTVQHASSVSSLRVDGVDAGSYSATLATVLYMFGIVGAGPSTFYPMVGYSLYFIVGKRAPTQDERWRIEWWVATNKTKQTIPNDNPYKSSPPMVSA